MHIKADFTTNYSLALDLKIMTAWQKSSSSKSKESTWFSIDHWSDKELREELQNLKASRFFKADKDEVLSFSAISGETIWVVGLGDKSKLKSEDIRKVVAKLCKNARSKKWPQVGFDVAGFDSLKDEVKTCQLIAETLYLCDYSFEKYKSKKPDALDQTFYLTNLKKKNTLKIQHALNSTKHICSSINVAKDFINEAPNVLNSEEYAKRIEMDVKKNLKSVKVKILNKAQIKKENMGLFLSVNAGSAYEPRLVHLTYEPPKSNSKTKHIALVGKGVTFDTGGYCIKPGASMAGMKNDMGGSATVYGAFRAAVLEKAPVKITCTLAITDNAVSSHATFPDAVVTGRNGKTVEILNTDAEGRLILADAIDYVCDLKPHFMIDAATLTGACLVALGNQVCAILGNDQKWIEQILASAKSQDEYMWQLPIINEWRADIKSKVADIKNIGTPMRAGTAIGAAFLEEFIKNDVKWAHLDIAGVVDSQSHLPYCSPHGASGLIIRTLTNLLVKG